MLSLVEIEALPERRRVCRESVEAVNVLGMNCIRLKLLVPDGASERSLKKCFSRCEALMHSLRVTELCFRAGFPYEVCFREMGFCRVDVKALMRAAAGDIVSRAARETENAFIYAPRLDSDVFRTFTRLCESFRYVTADLPGSEMTRLCEIAGEFGVSPAALRRDRIINADAAVFFGQPEKRTFVSGNCMTLFTDGSRGDMIYGGKEIKRIIFRFPERVQNGLPEGFPALELVSAALSLGKIVPENIKINLASV